MGGGVSSIEEASDDAVKDALQQLLKKDEKHFEVLLQQARASLWRENNGSDSSKVELPQVGRPHLDGIELKKLSLSILRAHNQVRTDPSSFIPKLEAMLPMFEGNKLRLSPQFAILTKEGASAVNECIKVLANAKPIGPLKDDMPPGLVRAAKDHALDCGKPGGEGLGHTGSDGSSSEMRISRYGDWKKTMGENISFGRTTGDDVVIQLLVDDGIPSRGHRKNILNPDFGVAGIYCATQPRFGCCAVIDYCGGYGPKAQARKITASTGHPIPEELVKVLNQFPDGLEALRDKIERHFSDKDGSSGGSTITVDFQPENGSVKVIFKAKGGSESVASASWGVKNS